MITLYILPNVDYGRDLNAKVTQDFTYGEFVSSMTAVKNEIENIPNEEEWQNIELLCRLVLQPLRDKIGAINITSGFRCKELNDAVGSNDYSFHSIGCAINVKECLANGVQIPGTKEEIVALAFTNGYVKTVEERHAESYS